VNDYKTKTIARFISKIGPPDYPEATRTRTSLRQGRAGGDRTISAAVRESGRRC
jgi:hypothetical protein